MNRRGSEATSVRDQMRISENELSDITRIAKVGFQHTELHHASRSKHLRMSSNLNSLLKERIRDAVAAIYDERGSASENRYTTPEQLSKALLDALFPEEHDHNTEVTGVVKVPTVSDSEESTDSKKERKKRAPMSEEAKAEMAAKRKATIAAKKAAEGSNAAAAPAAAPAEEAKPEAKERKPRGPMSEEAKAAMAAKRKATLEAKKAAAE